jgi:hypothetical protein
MQRRPAEMIGAVVDNDTMAKERMSRSNRQAA